MKRLLLICLLVFPYLLKAQEEKENYTIYSQFLQHVKADCKGKADFVIRESTDYGRKDRVYIPYIVEELRSYFNHAPASVLYMSTYDSLMNGLRRDTAWIDLVQQLDKKITQQYIVKNNFPPDLKVTIISNEKYYKYFRNDKKRGENWKHFHRDFPVPAYLIDLSEVVNDGKRAVFYFARRWDGRGGEVVALFSSIKKINYGNIWVLFLKLTIRYVSV